MKKKILTTILTLILMVSCVSVTTFAAEINDEVSLTATCTHSWNTSTTYVEGKGTYVSAAYCKRYKVTTKVCSKCGETEIAYSYTNNMAHNKKLTSARCTGSKQTIIYYCKYCDHNINVTQACPGAPHTGACQYLPV